MIANADYIVIGGGTAGLALGSTLAENPDIAVTVLEAGPENVNDPLISTVSLLGHQFDNPLYDWAMSTVPQKFCDDRKVKWARGKMLGGSSAINFQVWSCPPKSDVDAWEQLGNPGWNWAQHRTYLKKFEGVTLPSDTQVKDDGIVIHPEVYGYDGPIKLMYPELIGKANRILIDAMQDHGLQMANNPHAGDPYGICTGLYTWDHKTLSRVYAASAFYHSKTSQPNFKVVCGAYVTRILTESKHGQLVATGVEFKHENTTQVIYANKEVILTAGTVQTPQILELSGIGDPTILNPLGITPKLDLPGVGANLQDHVIIPMSYELDSGTTWGTWDCLFDADQLAAQKKLIMERKGVLAMACSPLVLVTLEEMTSPERAKEIIAKQRKYFEDNRDRYSDTVREQNEMTLSALESGRTGVIEIIGWAGHPFVPGESGKEYLTILAILTRPVFRGTIHIHSADPMVLPNIDPHYFEEEFDFDMGVEAIRYGRRLFQQEKLKKITTKEIRPGPTCETDDELKAYIKTSFNTCFHPLGTASMLPKEKGGVVDTSLRVYGTKNIRVADCSIAPLNIACHVQAMAYGIAGQAADILKREMN